MLEELEKDLDYIFKNKKYLEMALTHSSYSHETNNKNESYERLEFLGDSVLGLITSDYIFLNCPNLPEGDLTKLRASLVCEKTLCKFSQKLNVGKYLRLSNGEKKSGGEKRVSILADVFESLTAAIYLDGNIKYAENFVLKFIIPEINNASLDKFCDYKTSLQEIAQKNPEEVIKYILTDQKGPDHNKIFTVEVRINSNTVGVGAGRSKKEAEQNAAKKTLEIMGY
ncbi:MAG: ribonuclease III [Candidatus Paraimprobicoccus trichonymphae]|uniref:Ribonuclease 3 n=1 Tax=Candidatus Paraimprobicoccus trichonymphae TaxID=3033793 RepID=A0AA48I444_9FIRM|nr:MAG: ribonuclease III [Candidatus Paraimprobicoccus trichonymphae]